MGGRKGRSEVSYNLFWMVNQTNKQRNDVFQVVLARILETSVMSL